MFKHINRTPKSVSARKVQNYLRLLSASACAGLTGVTVCGSALAQTSPPPMNLSRYMPVTASSGANTAKYAVDGLVCEESRWVSDNTTAPQWLEVALPGSFQIGSANIITGEWDSKAVANFSLQSWTGGQWKNIPGATIAGNTKTQRQIVFSAPVTTDKVRFYSDDDGVVAVKELAVFAPNGGAAYPIGTEIDIRSGMLPKITSSSMTPNSGLRPYLAYDGFVSDDSRWRSDDVKTQHWLQYDFVKEREIAYAHIYLMAKANSAESPRFGLKYWDGNHWMGMRSKTVNGNTPTEKIVTFNSTIRTTKIRLLSDDDGPIGVKEMVLLPPNGGAGYPIGTGVIMGSPPAQKWNDFSDNFYNIKSRTSGFNLRTAPNGQVTVEDGDTSFAQQYNILLNIGTDTYRICNRANEHCLEVAGGSLASGAIVREGDYNALPYQQWRLNKVGANYELVNAYSGLVLTTNGTVAGSGLSQQKGVSSNAQQWTLPYVTHFPKKGSNWANVSDNFVDKYNTSHWYGWTLGPGIKESAKATPTQFQPMLWSNSQDRIEELVLTRPQWAVSDVPTYLIGYNEPSHGDQSDMTVQEGLDEWSRMEQVKLPLVSPQPDGQWDWWIAGFMKGAEGMGFRIERGGTHIYPTGRTPNPDAYTNDADAAFSKQGKRPVWITEWNWVNWGGPATWTAEQMYTTVAEALWRLEADPSVARHEFFAFSAYWKNGAPGAFEKDNAMLPLGQLYAAWDGDLEVRPNTSYHLHNRGTHVQMQSKGGVPGPTSIDTVDATINWQLVPASGGKYFLVSSDGQRLSSDGKTVSLVAAGTTGAAVEWALVPQQYGWYYLDHPATKTRLDSGATSHELAMYANTNTWDTLRWRFIKAYSKSTR